MFLRLYLALRLLRDYSTRNLAKTYRSPKYLYNSLAQNHRVDMAVRR